MKKILKNKSTILIVAILILAGFLRLYQIAAYQTFLGDEGRDVLVAKGILEGKLTLLGPRASAGDFFTGPIYYYMMAPFLLLFHYDPVGPAVMIALLSVATVYLIYRFGREWFGEKAGLYAAALYAVSPLVIAYSRSSWNPNPMPFFSLLILYILNKAVKKYSWKKFLFAGILFGIAFQLHYIETFLGVIIFFFILFGHFIVRVRDVKPFKTPAFLRFLLFNAKTYLQFFAGFLIGISPFLAFEARHGFPNTRTVFRFIFEGEADPGRIREHASFVGGVIDVFFRIFGRLITRYPSPELEFLYNKDQLQVWFILTLILAFFSIFILLKQKNKLIMLLFSLWLFLGVFLFGFYKKEIYDYYFEFMFPLPFLLVGNALGEGAEYLIKKKWVQWTGVAIFLILFAFNLYDMPFKYPPHNQKQKAEEVADFVLSKTDSKPFNFALLTKGNSDHAFRYFFHIKGRDPVVINNTLDDPQRNSVTDQLLIICDYKDCQPLGNPLFEVAGFGRADIAGRWGIDDVVIYKLIHYKGAE